MLPVCSTCTTHSPCPTYHVKHTHAHAHTHIHARTHTHAHTQLHLCNVCLSHLDLGKALDTRVGLCKRSFVLLQQFCGPVSENRIRDYCDNGDCVTAWASHRGCHVDGSSGNLHVGIMSSTMRGTARHSSWLWSCYRQGFSKFLSPNLPRC
jgi:hypothetical protein